MYVYMYVCNKILHVWYFDTQCAHHLSILMT